VQRERHCRHAPADAPPPGAKEIDRAAQWMAHDDVGRLDRPPVLEQEGKIRPERRQQRTDKAHADGQRDAGHRGALFRSLSGPKSATTDWGAGSCQSKVRRIAFEWPMPAASSARPGSGARATRLPGSFRPQPTGVLLSMRRSGPYSLDRHCCFARVAKATGHAALLLFVPCASELVGAQTSA
jgi:hypothetical protein